MNTIHPLEYSRHALQRAAQRNLSLAEIHYVIAFGQRYHRQGALICYLRQRDIPLPDQCEARWARLAGTAVTLTPDGGLVITAWRNRQRGLKRIKRKPQYRLAPGGCPDLAAWPGAWDLDAVECGAWPGESVMARSPAPELLAWPVTLPAFSIQGWR
jgi:hypothetical protein